MAVHNWLKVTLHMANNEVKIKFRVNHISAELWILAMSYCSQRVSAQGCTFKNMTEPDIDLPLRERHPCSRPQGGAAPSRTSSSGTSKTKWLKLGCRIPASLSRWGHMSTNHLSKLAAQSKSAGSTTDPHILPLFPQVSNIFLPWSQSVS